MDNKFNLGIIGVGNWGKTLVRSFSGQATVKSYFHNGNPENDAWMSEHYHEVTKTTSYEAMLADPNIDAIIIATPISTHTKLTEMALNARKHVFVEKPLSVNPDDVVRLFEIAEQNNVSIFTGYIFLYSEVLREIKKTLAGKQVLHIRFEWDKWGTFRDPISLNLLPHDLAIAIDILGKISSICKVNKFGFVTEADIENFFAEFESGATVEFIFNRVSPKKEKRVSIFTGTEEYFWCGDTLARIDKSGSNEAIYIAKKENLFEECRFFLETLSCPKEAQRNCEISKSVTEALSKIVHDC